MENSKDLKAMIGTIAIGGLLVTIGGIAGGTIGYFKGLSKGFKKGVDYRTPVDFSEYYDFDRE